MSKLLKASAGKAQEHLELVGSLTDEPSRTPFPSEGRHGRKGQAAGAQSYTWTLNEQPTNVSRVGIDAHSVRMKRHKVEGAQM